MRGSHDGLLRWATKCLLGNVPVCCTAVSALICLLDNCKEGGLDANQKTFRDLLDVVNVACIVGAPLTFDWKKIIAQGKKVIGG
jgi:hypothetical protein